MSANDETRARLAALLGTAGDEFDLAEAALLLAAQEYPGLVVRAYLAQLDELADGALPWVESAAAQGRWSDGLSRYVFAELGFRGNLERYGDPRNSYLNDVLERRTGLPITLSVLYLELARRCNRRAEGVGLPGHFIVRVWEADGDVLLDPFNGGVRLSEADCQARVKQQYGGTVSFHSEYLHGTPKREILARMLRNLKSAYLGIGDLPRALRAVENLLVVIPHSGPETRDRGLLRMQVGDLRGALADLRRYLGTGPTAAEAEPLRATLQRLEALWERRN